MDGLDALLERRFRFSVCFRIAIGLAGKGKASLGKAKTLLQNGKALLEKRMCSDYDLNPKPKKASFV